VAQARWGPLTNSAGELLAAFAARELSPVDALAECESRFDDSLGVWAAMCLDAARVQARAAEAAWRAGAPTGPLCGVPIAVKDLIDTAGVETACGSLMLAGRVPDRDAEVVRRIRAAGAIVLGKTRTHEFAWGMSMVGPGNAPITRNPHDPARMPGGSSGGSGAALAAGMVPLALGTDTGGSIRLPAAWCRVYGFKPTHGVVSVEGVWPLAPSLDHVGPMARTAEDCALLFEVLGGPAAQTGSAPLCADAGVLPSGERAAELYKALMLPEALATHRRLGLWPDRADEYTPSVRARLETAASITQDEIAAARAELDTMRAHMDAVFADVDIVRSPVAASGPPRFDEGIDARDLAAPFVVLQDLLGLPALALPDGTQLTGQRGSDALVLAAGRTSD
jgi:aspartyl-tRNA(Asn)/glutamyl-tRNA(Gln) amidotransferase subunit A